MRDIFLLTYPIRPNRFNGARAHWGVFIPSPAHASSDNETELEQNRVGKVIHVTGTPFTGYGLEFKRNYDLASTGRAWRLFPLATVDDQHVDSSVHADGQFVVDVTPKDALEAAAKKVDPPGASAEPLNPRKGKRCQEWIREYVAWLIQRGIVPSTASQALDDAKATEPPLP